MTIAQARYFLAIVEYGSFSAAADEVYLSQSSLSKQIKALETELGIELFSRGGNKIALTPEGKLFQKHAKALVSAYSKLTEDLEQYKRSTQAETVRLGVLPLLNDYQISNQLAGFRSKLGVQICIQEDNQEDLMRMLHQKKIDLAILRLDYLDPDEYDYWPTREDLFVVVCDGKYRSQLKPLPVTFRMLERIPFISLGQESSIYRTTFERFEKAGCHPHVAFTSTQHLHLLSLVEAGSGITVLPRQMVNLEMFPKLSVLPLEEFIPTAIGIVRLANDEPSNSANNLFRLFTSAEPVWADFGLTGANLPSPLREGGGARPEGISKTRG